MERIMTFTTAGSTPALRFFNSETEQISLRASLFQNADTAEIHLTGQTAGGTSFHDQAEQLFNETVLFFDKITARKGSVLVVRCFVSDSTNQQQELEQLTAKIHNRFGECAVSIVEQPPLEGGKIDIWVYGVSGAVEKKAFGDNGVELTRQRYRHLWSAGMTDPRAGTDSNRQTDAIFRNWCNQLQQADCTLKHNCLRTWLYVRDIDVNYGGVVVARRELFAEEGMTKETHFIASTGIEGQHSDSEVKVMMDGCAVAGITPQQVTYLNALENLNPTHEYGVTFERGTSIDYGDRRHIYISGTASIDSRGEILHHMDPSAQAERAMENIAALLADANAEWKDMVQMLVYLRDPSDFAAIEKYFNSQYPDTPKVFVHAPVCRPGWLVEVECIAVKSINRPEFAIF